MEVCLAIISDTIWFTPAFFVLAAMMALLLEVVRRKEQVPVGAVASRPPGESMRLNLDDLNEKLILRLLITIGVAILTGVAARAVTSGDNLPLVHAVMFTGSGVALALTLWTWNLVTRWHQSYRGFEGERLVGRELNLLMLDGCRVFHDLVDPRIGNIDHIIVAPHAIFVVETRIQPRKGVPNDSTSRVIFNGQELRFPGFTTSEPLRKAARNAKWLEKFILRNTGLNIPVQPLLVLPGWQVQCTNPGRVCVISPEQISSVAVDKAAPELYAAQRQRIVNLLDQKCRFQPL
ncbi:MAG: NERD domain-containing protein [Verrucomicrobia bacterium]|jgi:hypothetical protein|nr:NERD domain-containing protein [Verrucomicrobiota bacterium]